MRITVLLIGILMSMAGQITAQNTEPSTELSKASPSVNWLSWEEAMDSYEKAPKKLLISIYTRWCNWCKKMDASTFDEPGIASLINDQFYPVKLDAQSDKELVFNGKTYKNRNEGPNSYHDLAIELLHQRRSFPTIVFLDEQLQYIQAIVGYKSVVEFETIASYFGYNDYKKTPWSAYEKQFKSAFANEKH